ncbi:unnamed protein product [Prunus armeniaca]|uniref:Uncharacterized protein n=1 Tax=Prunus armeniaca TaxID=36596 RepID=A0A6J5WV10_PRUAR|nr:hypothetical protein GBA52_025195 [Prunus armeniaca]CAB4305540.1 unnamed protein product [Prunus armeniaca]
MDREQKAQKAQFNALCIISHKLTTLVLLRPVAGYCFGGRTEKSERLKDKTHPKQMAAVSVSAFSPLASLRTPNRSHSLAIPIPSPTLSFRNVSTSFQRLTHKDKRSRIPTIIRAVEEETLIPVEGEEQKQEEPASSDQQEQPVSVPVSPSDTLTMLFQADGTMSDAALPSVTKALEETQGITNLKVEVVEGIATVELTKQTTVQATGVASSLVETIQSSGFKLQTLNLSFDEEEEIAV